MSSANADPHDTFRTLLIKRQEEAQRELDTLTRFGRAIHNPHDTTQLYRQLYDEASNLMTVDAGFIAMLLPDRMHLQSYLSVDKGIDYGLDAPWSFHPDGPVAAVVHQGQSVIMADLDAELTQRFPAVAPAGEPFGDDAETSHSWMMVPILRNNAVIGVVNVQSYQIGVYGPREERLLSTLASMLAIGLAQADLVQRLQKVRDALSVPLIPMSEQHLLLPLVGLLDEERLSLVQQQLLHTIQGSRYRFIIVSLAAVQEMRTTGLQGLRRLIQAISLLGARCILSGISQELSLMLADTGIDFRQIEITANLPQALARTGLLQ